MTRANIFVLIKKSEDVLRTSSEDEGERLHQDKCLLGSIKIKTEINPPNSCFKVLKIARNKGKLTNAVNFAFISKFQIPYPNLKSLHLRARFINVTNIANIQK